MRNNKARRFALPMAIAGTMILAGCQKHAASSTPAAQSKATTPPAAPTVTLKASPGTITKGGSTALIWSSSNANQLTLYPGVGTVAAEGTQRVSPNDSMTYTLRATGPGGVATATATVDVAMSSVGSGPTAMANADQPFNVIVKDAYFDFNKSDLRPDAREALMHDADYLKAHPDIKITVEGHCDDRGGEEYNLGLGDRRAAATKQYLVSQGLSPNRIQIVSFGKEHPFCTTDNDACWQENRRGHLVGNP
jgi:peptidoglycan-associated lipoprotein